MDYVDWRRLHGWTASRGLIDDPHELFEGNGEGEILPDVEAGAVTGVEGDCPLAVAIRQDRQLTELRRATSTLALRILQLEDQLGTV